MARPEKLPPTVDPGAYFDRELAAETWAKIERLSQFSLDPQSRDMVERALAKFTEALDALPIAKVHAAAAPLAKALFETHRLASSKEAAAIFDAAGWPDSKVHQALLAMVTLAGSAHHFAKGSDFGSTRGATAQEGVNPLTDFVRCLAHAFFISTGKWPDGLSNLGGGLSNNGTPCFTAFFEACYETLPVERRPYTIKTLIKKARPILKEFINNNNAREVTRGSRLS
jgi:hypothetical protein